MNQEELGNKFLIKDGNEYALIETSQVKSNIIQDKEYFSAKRDGIDPELDAFLSKAGYSAKNWLGFKKTNIRYQEGILEKDETIAVYGKGQWKDAKEFNLTTPSKKVLVITGYPVFLSDDPGLCVG